METVDFVELISQLEAQLKNNFKFVLLESLYTPYAFGSGMIAYKIQGRNIKVIFDGRDNQVEMQISSEHAKYPTGEWITVFIGTPLQFLENVIGTLRGQYER